MAHDLLDLLKSYGGKTCFIGHNPSSYVHNRCVIVCFVDKASKLAAIDENSGVHGKWVVTSQNWVHLANIYKRKQAPIVRPVFFGEKTWAQIAGGSFFYVVLLGFLGVGLSLGAKPVLMVSDSLSVSCLVNQLASLECSLELLTDQVSVIMEKLSFVKMVPLVFKLHILLPVAFTLVISGLNSDMTLDNTTASFLLPLLVVADPVADFSLSNFKVLTIKVGGLESKIVALEVLVEFVLDRLDHLCFGLSLLTSLTSQ
ncbi:hypothetical protein G9A89_003355 [Geosiphon pyriformis]|nr:hypothetical protein G9A89_003355 [Geosiphon pyriformis]